MMLKMNGAALAWNVFVWLAVGSVCFILHLSPFWLLVPALLTVTTVDNEDDES